MMPGKISTFTPPILNFCPCWFLNSFGFCCSSYQKKDGGDLKSESKKTASVDYFLSMRFSSI